MPGAAAAQKGHTAEVDSEEARLTPGFRGAGLQNVAQALSKLKLNANIDTVVAHASQGSRNQSSPATTVEKLEGLKASVEEVSAALTDGDEGQLTIMDVLGKVGAA